MGTTRDPYVRTALDEMERGLDLALARGHATRDPEPAAAEFVSVLDSAFAEGRLADKALAAFRDHEIELVTGAELRLVTRWGRRSEALAAAAEIERRAR